MATATKAKKTVAKPKAKEVPRQDLADKEPTQLHQDFADYIQEQTGIEVDVKAVQLATILRMDFQRSETNQARLQASKAAREAAAQARADKRAAREAAKTEKASTSTKKAAAPAKKTATAGKASTAKAPAKKAPARRTKPKAAAATEESF